MSPSLDKTTAADATERPSSFKMPGTPTEKGTYIPIHDPVMLHIRQKARNRMSIRSCKYFDLSRT